MDDKQAKAPKTGESETSSDPSTLRSGRPMRISGKQSQTSRLSRAAKKRKVESLGRYLAPGRKIYTGPGRSTGFVGRDYQLTTIQSVLGQPYDEAETLKPRWCILHGQGGVGKTEIAVEYAHCNAERIFWIHAQNDLERVSSYLNAARKIGLLDLGDVGSSNAVDTFRTWLEETEENWLLVFDNAEDFKDISGLVPDTIISHSGVLVTTQLPNFGPVDLPKLLVKPFDSTEGSELLLHQVGRRQGDDNGVAKAQEISELVGGLPLHLVTMGGFITQTKCSFQEFIETFHDFLPFEPRGARAAFRYDKNPAAVNDIGLSKLESEPRQLLNILAFLNPRVSEKILLADHEHAMLQFLKPGNRTQFLKMVFDLTERHLVDRDISGLAPCLSTHRTVLQGVLHKLVSDEDLHEALEKACHQAFLIVRRACPLPSPIQIPTPEHWPDYEEAIPHIMFLRVAAEHTGLDGSVEFARLLSDSGMNLWERGLSKDGLLLLRSAEQILDRLGANESVMRANIHIIIGLFLTEFGIEHREEVASRFEQALRIREELQRQTPPIKFTRTQDVLLHNAKSNWATGTLLQYYKYDEALPVFEECLKKYQSWGQREDISYEYAKYDHHVGVVKTFQQDFPKAIELAARAVDTVAIGTGPRSAIANRYKFDLACTYLQAGHLEQSLQVHQEVLAARIEMGGDCHNLALQSFYALGVLYYELGRMSEAEESMRTALELSSKTNWPEAALARTKYHLSLVLMRMGQDTAEAQQLQTSALATLDRLLPLHPMPKLTDKLALFDHLQPNFEGRFVTPALLREIKDH